MTAAADGCIKPVEGHPVIGTSAEVIYLKGHRAIALLIGEVSLLRTLASATVSIGRGVDYLDLLLCPGLPMFVTDQVRWEATRRADDDAVASVVRFWFERHPGITTVSTECGALRTTAGKVHALTDDELGRLAGRSVAEAFARGKVPAGADILVDVDDRSDEAFFPSAHIARRVSLFGFLSDLERAFRISSADDIIGVVRSFGGRRAPAARWQPLEPTV